MRGQQKREAHGTHHSPSGLSKTAHLETKDASAEEAEDVGHQEPRAPGGTSRRMQMSDLQSALQSGYSAILTTALDAIIFMDKHSRILEFNPAAEEIFGYSRADVLGRSVAETIIPERLQSAHHDGMARYLTSGAAHILGKRIEMQAVRANGEEFPVELSVTGVPSGDTEIFIATIRDITSRVRYEQERQELLEREKAARSAAEAVSERMQVLQKVTNLALEHLHLGNLLRDMLQNIRDVLAADNVAILLVDHTGRELTMYNVFGPEEEVARTVRVPVGKGVAGKIAATRLPLVIADLATANPVNEFLRERLKSLMGVPLMIDDRVIGVMHVSTVNARHFTQDEVHLLQLIADRLALAIDRSRLFEATQGALRQVQAIAEQLRSQADEMNTIMEAIPGGIFVSDAHGKLLHANRYGVALMGESLDTLLSSTPATRMRDHVYHLDGSPLVPEDYPISQALRGITRTDFRFIMRQRGTGRELHVQASFAPIYDNSGDITGAVAFVSDISDLYRLERQKDEFLSIASHELKTPLTTLKILTQLARRRYEQNRPDDPQNIWRMERSIARIEILVNDLLDVTRIDSGKLALRPDMCGLVALVREVADDQTEATDRIIEVQATDPTVMICADAERIEQVITNLISNAIKYSPADQPVRVVVSSNGHTAGFTVQDRGSGIPVEYQQHLFERFYRVPGVQIQSGSGVGLGLGLYISREIVERHGGTMWLDSSTQAGSIFHVMLPVEGPPYSSPDD